MLSNSHGVQDHTTLEDTEQVNALATRLQDDFELLRGELAPFAGEQENIPDARRDERDALQQRVGNLSRSAIALFRSQLQLVQRQWVHGRAGSQDLDSGRGTRGLLILFEGLDRSGKGTQVQAIVSALEVEAFQSAPARARTALACSRACLLAHARVAEQSLTGLLVWSTRRVGGT